MALTIEMHEEPLETVKASMRAGTADPSMASSMIEVSNVNNGGSEGVDRLKNVAANVAVVQTLYDCPSPSLANILKYRSQGFCRHNIYIGHAVQPELEAVIGRSRLPTLEVRFQLP
ncbi:hypothetical protein OF83DRAFT_1177143 [Amylostereum chailletii]|nr:hypothetical protein OF83DRAFT_1177143 [Amylostereum chailletii]